MTLDMYSDPPRMAASALSSPPQMTVLVRTGTPLLRSAHFGSSSLDKSRKRCHSEEIDSKPDLELQLCLKLTTASRASETLGIAECTCEERGGGFMESPSRVPSSFALRFAEEAMRSRCCALMQHHHLHSNHAKRLECPG